MPAIDWRRVTTLGRLAEVVNAHMAKRTCVRVTGQLEEQTWADKTSREPRRRAVIVASQVLRLAATLLGDHHKVGATPVARHGRQFLSGSGHQQDAHFCYVLGTKEAR